MRGAWAPTALAAAFAAAKDTEPSLFEILDGIVSSDYADDTMQSIDAISNYAEACGRVITPFEARWIQAVGIEWGDQQMHGNGDWGRMRAEAKDVLDA